VYFFLVFFIEHLLVDYKSTLRKVSINSLPGHDVTTGTSGSGGNSSVPVKPLPALLEKVSSPEGIMCKDDCREIFDSGVEVVLTAVPDEGSSFIGWDGDCMGSDLTCTLTVNRAKTVTAKFYSFPWPIFMPAIQNQGQQ
jgi:hypothetical protein